MKNRTALSKGFCRQCALVLEDQHEASHSSILLISFASMADDEEPHRSFSQLAKMPKKSCLLFPVFFFLLLLNFWPCRLVNSLSADGLALLRIKKAMELDPCRMLSDWIMNDENPCAWTGVTCDTTTQRVVSLNITGNRFPDRSSEMNFLPPDFEPFCSSTMQHNKIRCTLTGSLSLAIGNLSQLRTLSLPFHAFHGELPRELGALRSLEALELTGNFFTGLIPVELGQLSNLSILDLAYNHLDGEIPMSLSGCKRMRSFNLAGNRLTGKIPSFLGELPGLELLSLSFNQLDGPIPQHLTRTCSNLKHLHLSGNFLTGKIPPELGNCTALHSLKLFSNVLSGKVPSELGQLRRLQLLDVSRNSLDGHIPLELGNCYELSVLILTNLLPIESHINHSSANLEKFINVRKDEHNHFSGILPNAISSLPKMRILWAPNAVFDGALPLDWGKCQSLEVLNLRGNNFGGTLPSELGNCKNLVYLDLSSNDLEGRVLETLQIPCMLVFNISRNRFSGNFPSGGIGTCPASRFLSFLTSSPLSAGDVEVFSYFSTLYCGSVRSSVPLLLAPEGIPVVHDLSYNSLTGFITGSLLGSSLVEKHPLYSLFVSGNQLTGSIPSTLFDLCRDLQAFAVGLSHNFFSGAPPIDGMLGCKSLKYFVAAFNNMTGTILTRSGEMRFVAYVNLVMNNLSTKISSHTGQVQELRYLVLDSNKSVGDIQMESNWLLSLNVSGKTLTGEVLKDFVNLNQPHNLIMDSSSLLCGNLCSFTNLTAPVVINLSFDNLSRTVPMFKKLESHDSTPKPSINLQETWLSAQTPAPTEVLVKRNHRNLIFVSSIASGSAIVTVVVILGILFQYTKRRMPNRAAAGSGKKLVIIFGNINPHLSYENIIRATANFSIDNLIGNGGFGATYKAEILPGLLVAVKRLSLGRFQGTQQFDAEIRTVGRIRHPNLVTLMGYHSSDSEMFLIYNYLPGGNLETLIHNSEEGTVTWNVRYKIALDIAQALAYLHHKCIPKVLHRDIKPSNILLDNKLNAYLSDFGLARLLEASETHATTGVAGTFGYVAPEYAITCRVSDKADVYSYGVLFLELLTGKRALDPSFSDCDDGFNIVTWAYQQLKNGQAKHVFAPGLWQEGPHSEMIDALKLAITCTIDTVSKRPTMEQVVDRLKTLRLSSFRLVYPYPRS